VNRLASVVIGIYTLIGFVVLAIAAILSPHVAQTFAEPLSTAASQAASTACLLLGVQLLCVFIGSGFSGVLAGHDRYDLVNGVALAGIAAKLIAIPLLVRPGGTAMITLAVVTTSATLATTIGLAVITYRRVPTLALRPTRPTLDELRFLYGFGLQSFILAFAIKLISYTDTVVIGFTLGATAVALYVPALQLVEYARVAVGSVPSVLLPRLATFITNQELAPLRQAYLDTMRVAVALSAWLAATLISVGPAFLGRWLGPEFGVSSQWVRVFLAAGAMAQVISSQVPFPFYQALQIVALPAGVLICEAALNLGLSLWLAPKMGIVGVALATALPAVCVGLPLLPPYVCRRLGVPVRRLVFSSIVPGGLILPATLAAYWVSAQFIPSDTYVGIAARTISSTPAILAVFLLAFPREQQQAILQTFRVDGAVRSAKTAIRRHTPEWLLALVFGAARRVHPEIVRRSSLIMCSTPAIGSTELPPGYQLASVVGPEPLQAWREALGAAGLSVTDEDWRRDFSNPDTADVFVLKVEAAVVATAGLTWNAARTRGLITWVGVSKAHQGKGLAGPLIAACLGRARSAGLPTVFLVTDDHRLPAIKTYLRAGFIPCLSTWDWTHRPRWRAIQKVLDVRFRNCANESHTADRPI
jgi:O-antigen/teichoic acid export membrane protein/GNAT superfamily N-acetyltransferase